ncbi:MAG: hypothetical protein OXE77_05560 [Flavobacteriaceae bacterium]|nr:hypothetical protein [Flavobacteriaceae bacterium]MCY4267192.1 hypothetical protein [Flavobacteriaceae bacterium]
MDCIRWPFVHKKDFYDLDHITDQIPFHLETKIETKPLSSIRFDFLKTLLGYVTQRFKLLLSYIELYPATIIIN